MFVLRRGGAEERIAALALVGSSIATGLLFIVCRLRFDASPAPFLVCDLLVLAIVLPIALWSRRYWPIPFAALQVATVLSLIAPFFGNNLVSYGLGVMQGLWAYPQLLILIAAVVRRPVGTVKTNGS